MSPPTLHVFVIHAQHLTQRAERIHGVVQQLRVSAMSKGYEVRPQILVTHEASDINQKLQEYQNLVNYDAIGDAELDGMRQPLSVETISNMEKHKEAWKRIFETDSDHPEDLFLVIEDDTILLPNGPQHFQEVIAAAPRKPWDIMFLGISASNVVADKECIDFLAVKESVGKILPAKDSYFIKQQTAKRLFDMLTMFRFSLRIQLSYMFSQTVCRELRVVHPTKPVLLDGSKVGIVPSSLHPSNILVFNREYMDLLKYLSQDASFVQKELSNLRALYKAVQHLHCPDIMHLYGVLLFKAGKVMDAEEMLQTAVKEMTAQQGILNSRSDLMNNLIMLYQHMQRDLPELLKSTSSYDDPAMARADV